MTIEYEAKFLNVDKHDIRTRLTKAGATLVRPEFLQRRIPFHLPPSARRKGSWLRVRDEGDKVTLTLKVQDGDKIEDQKEAEVVVSDFDTTVEILKGIGCEAKSYQETKRELWNLNGAEVTIDEWPFLEPFVEIEGSSEGEVTAAAEKLGFDYRQALFCAPGRLYQLKYGIPEDQINSMPQIVFDGPNPFTAAA